MTPPAGAESRAPQRGSCGVPLAVFRTGRSARRSDRVRASRLRRQAVPSRAVSIPTRVARPWECRERASQHRDVARGAAAKESKTSAVRPIDFQETRGRQIVGADHRTAGNFGRRDRHRRAASVARDRADPPNRTSAPEDIRRVPNCSPRSARRGRTTKPRPPALRRAIAAKIGSRKSSSSSNAT